MTASDDRNSLVIRDPARSDETNWRRLWAGYCAFYETNVPEAVTAATWKRMLTPGSPLFGRIAQLKGEVAGFTISVTNPVGNRGTNWQIDQIVLGRAALLIL